LSLLAHPRRMEAKQYLLASAVTPSCYLAYVMGRMIPWFATAVISKVTQQSHDNCWRLFATKLYNSFLNRITLVVRLGLCCSLVRPFTEDPTVIREIFDQEIYEKFYEPRVGDTVIDVGAHAGYFTLKAAQTVRANGLVVAVEPCPSNYALLKKNAGYVRSCRIIVAEVALKGEAGTTRLYLKDGTVGHSTIFKTNRSIEIQAMTLDQLCQELNVKHVDFIKINAEGAEHEILLGAEKTLRVKGLKLAIQVHGDTVRNKVVELLKKAGYNTIVRNRFVYASCMRAHSSVQCRIRVLAVQSSCGRVTRVRPQHVFHCCI
jgi:FkbM family methyltransferase